MELAGILSSLPPSSTPFPTGITLRDIFTISFLETGVAVSTDSQGFFILNNLPATATVFDIDCSSAQPAPDGSGYASFREGLPLLSHVTNQVARPFFMPRLATESLTTVPAGLLAGGLG